MIAEWGHFSLILAWVFSGLLAVMPWWALRTQQPVWIGFARPLSLGVFFFLSLSFVALVVSFIQDDFSVKYVVSHSHSMMPMIYKVSAAWGGHEGSLLMWVWILSLWMALAAHFSNVLSLELRARLLSVMGMIALGFIAFVELTSNPFERLLDVPAEGMSLNPLLQDPALAIHPPMLYMGYVGFAIAFAMSVAILLAGEAKKSDWLWLRNWVLAAWLFLTLGIAIGSWWAYYELGWGGWWFWDPVENASLLPWLAGTALMHSLAVTIARNRLIKWTLLLAVLAFSLSLLGTFLVRSGVLTSVHSFAADPSRGLFILLLLGLAVGGALWLYGERVHLLKQAEGFKPVSRETALLTNNLLLLVMLFSILLGTLYPLLVDALGVGKISVGAPYFNTIALPLAIPIFVLMGWAFVVRWGQDDAMRLLKASWPVALVSAVLAVALGVWMMPEWNALAVVLMALVFWIGLGAVRFGASQALLRPAVLAHVGFALSLSGMVMTSLFSVEKDVRMVEGETYALTSEYELKFVDIFRDAGPNYLFTRAVVDVMKQGEKVAEIFPEKRAYITTTMPMTEAGIDSRLDGDVFVALGEDLEQGAWSFRVQYKPFINHIWLGAFVMALAGAWGIWARRRKRVEGRIDA